MHIRSYSWFMSHTHIHTHIHIHDSCFILILIFIFIFLFWHSLQYSGTLALWQHGTVLPLLALHWWFQDTALHRIVMHCTVLILHFTLLVLHYITLSSGPHYTALHCTDTVLSNPHCVSPVTCHLSFVTDVCHTTHITVHSISTQYTIHCTPSEYTVLSYTTLPSNTALCHTSTLLHCATSFYTTLFHYTTAVQYSVQSVQCTVCTVVLTTQHCPVI